MIDQLVVQMQHSKENIEAFTQYHKDGSVWAKGQLKGNVPAGYWQWFRKDGTLMRSGHFEDGVPVSEWTTYDKNGHVYKVTDKKGGNSGERTTVALD